MKTPVRTVRIPDPLWTDLRERAKSFDTDASAVIRDLVTDWLADTALPLTPDQD